MARPSKYTPERVERFLQAIRLGAPYYLAAQYAGIDHSTFTNWLERYSDFSKLVKEAEGAAVVGWLAKIEKAANEGSWQAAAWKAERRYPNVFALHAKIDQTVEHSGHIDTSPRESLASRVASLAASFGTDEVLRESE